MSFEAFTLLICVTAMLLTMLIAVLSFCAGMHYEGLKKHKTIPLQTTEEIL